MGTMNKMRENTGVVLWILVVSFGVLWVIQDTGVTDTIGATTGEIIVVDGDAVSYDEYRRAVDAQVSAYRQQTGEPMTPQRAELEEDRVFDSLVEDKLREHEMDRLGITVTDEEVRNLVLGPNPHPIIKVYFGDGQGGVDQMLLQNFIENPDAEEQWVQLEDYLRQVRRQEKLDQLITATVRVSAKEVEDEYQRRNRSASTTFFALPYAAVQDSEVELTDRDVQSYYNANREDFRRERTYSVRTASITKNPSAEDTTATLEELAQLKENFANAEDDSLFLNRYGSESPYSSAYFTRGDVNEAVAEAVFTDPQPGMVIGPVVAGDRAHLVKVLDVRPAEEQSVRARHILFRGQEGDAEARAEARRKAEETLQRLRGGADFAALARELSEDPGSGRQGGDLGWFGPGRMVEPFEDAAFGAPLGRVVGPVATEYGYHLIEVTERATQEVRLADFALALRATPRTLDAAQEQLEDVQYYTEETGNFEQEVERRGLTSQTIQIQQDQRSIPGIGTSRTLMRFLERADEGDVSEVIELDDRFIVAYVEDITPAGYRPLEEVEAVVRAQALREKKLQMQRSRMAQALEANGFDGLGEALGVSPRTATVQMTSNVVPGLGREPIFLGTVFGLEEGATSGVVEGESAVFVVRVDDVTEPAPMTEAERDQLRDELLQQRRTLVQRQWLASLREKAEVKDMRNQYYQ